MASANPSFWDSQLFAAIIGAGSAMVIFVAGSALRYWKAKKAELESYIVALTFSRDEITFYIQLLDQLSGELGRIAGGFAKVPHDPFIIPTYSLYPKFLEQSKIDLARFRRNADLVRRVSRTHFELSHIAERLAELKRDWIEGPANLALARSNVEGFKKLVDDDIPGFASCAEALRVELETVQSELSNLEMMWL